MQIVNDPNKPEEPVQEQRKPIEQKRFYLTGLLLLAAGVLFFIDRATNFDLAFPLISWEFFLIVAGIYIGEKSSFTGFNWLVCIGIGAFFLFDDFFPQFDLRYYFAPILLVTIGLYFILGPKSMRRSTRRHRQTSNYNKVNNSTEKGFTSDNSSADDYIDVVSIFGGVQKKVTSKQFKGGEATSIFGGTELNLMQADFEGNVILELTQVFGGCTLIVPPHWELKTELVSIFGGVEDNRPNNHITIDNKKVVLLKGTSIFGGIEIKSY